MATKEKSKTPNNPALITGGIITWARERLGYSHKQVADEMGASVAADDIAQWEAEKDLPDFRKAQKLAAALHIPFGYLFLSHRPKNDIKVPDLRTVGSRPITEFTPNLLDQLRNLLLKQEWYRDYASEEARKPLSFVGRFNVNSSYEKVAADIANELGINSQFRVAASNWEGFLTAFMASAEAAGILVIRSGVVASASQRPLSVKEFRGFVLSEPIAPLVFINGADSTSAQVFTFAHELVHLWIGKSGISNPNPKKRSTDGGGNFYRTMRVRNSRILVSSVLEAIKA